VSATARCLTAAVTIASWIAVSNHCAFAAVAPKANPAPNECPFHSKPAKPQQPIAATQCCKILRAITGAKIQLKPIVDLADVDLAFAPLIVFAPAKISFEGTSLDTGPPGTTSFAELIWSMRAHAPPWGAA
jgi:hypothetical protein